MHSFFSKIKHWLVALRVYSLPISIMSWIVPFIFALLDGGSLKFGIIALAGIIILHLASNILDDTIDYIREKRKIDNGQKKSFNFQEGKCICIFNKSLTIKEYIIVTILLFLSAAIIGLYFLSVWGIKLLLILIPTIILCVLYPFLGCLGLGEVIIAIIFSPLLYLGTYFAMTGNFSFNILLLSISTGLLSVAVLHNHMLLDYKYDEENRKITLCRLCKSRETAYLLLCLIVSGAYLNIIVCCLLNKISPVYLLTFLSLPTAITLFKVMKIHIKNPEQEIKHSFFMGNINAVKKADSSQRNFLLKFLIVRNLLSGFTILLCISMIITKVLAGN